MTNKVIAFCGADENCLDSLPFFLAFFLSLFTSKFLPEKSHLLPLITIKFAGFSQMEEKISHKLRIPTNAEERFKPRAYSVRASSTVAITCQRWHIDGAVYSICIGSTTDWHLMMRVYSICLRIDSINSAEFMIFGFFSDKIHQTRRESATPLHSCWA